MTLLAAVALVWSAVRARAGSLGGYVVWLAVLLYVPYTYLLYVVTPYTDALLLSIAAIGLGAYGLLNGLFRLRGEVVAEALATVHRRGVAWFLLVVAALFTTLWLVDILSVWPGGVPDSLFILASGGEIDPSEPEIWSVMVLVAAGLLTAGARRMRPVADGWLRPSLW